MVKPGKIYHASVKVIDRLSNGSIVTVPISDEKWTEISRNERTIVIGTERFFATRCHPKNKWQIELLDRMEINGSKRVCVVAKNLTTREVTKFFKPYRKQ